MSIFRREPLVVILFHPFLFFCLSQQGRSEAHYVNRADLSWKALQNTFSTSSPGIYWNDLPDHPKRRTAFLWTHAMIMQGMLDNLIAGGVQVFLEAHAALQSYKVETRGFEGYAPNLNPKRDASRFWDDNGVTGLVFIRASKLIKDMEKELIEQIDQIWPFIESGLAKDGGEFWLELDPKPNRGVCSTGATSELSLRRLQVLGAKIQSENPTLEFAKKNMKWLDSHLLDNSTALYWNSWYENISDVPSTCVTGTNVCNWLFTYNQGYVINMLVLLFNATGESKYLEQAVRTAKASIICFDPDRLWGQPPAFNAIYFRALLLLNEFQPDPSYRNMMNAYLDRVWSDARDVNTGLFVLNGIGTYENVFGSIDQGAFVQMFAM